MPSTGTKTMCDDCLTEAHKEACRWAAQHNRDYQAFLDAEKARIAAGGEPIKYAPGAGAVGFVSGPGCTGSRGLPCVHENVLQYGAFAEYVRG